MGFKVCTAAITQGGEMVRVGDVVDSTSDLVTRYSSSFANIADTAIGTSEGATIKGIYLSSTVAVTVPAITDPDCAKVDVDVDAAFTMAPAVGDAVIAIPQEALPTNARLSGAWVNAANQVQVTFSSEAGNVSSGAKNFKFLVIDLT
jgi:hypothetical protein